MVTAFGYEPVDQMPAIDLPALTDTITAAELIREPESPVHHGVAESRPTLHEPCVSRKLNNRLSDDSRGLRKRGGAIVTADSGRTSGFASRHSLEQAEEFRDRVATG